MTLSPKERLVLNSANDRWQLIYYERDLAVSRFLGNGIFAGFIYATMLPIISCALTLLRLKTFVDTDKIQHEPKLPMKKLAAMKVAPQILMVLANSIFDCPRTNDHCPLSDLQPRP